MWILPLPKKKVKKKVIKAKKLLHKCNKSRIKKDNADFSLLWPLVKSDKATVLGIGDFGYSVIRQLLSEDVVIPNIIILGDEKRYFDIDHHNVRLINQCKEIEYEIQKIDLLCTVVHLDKTEEIEAAIKSCDISKNENNILICLAYISASSSIEYAAYSQTVNRLNDVYDTVITITDEMISQDFTINTYLLYIIKSIIMVTSESELKLDLVDLRHALEDSIVLIPAIKKYKYPVNDNDYTNIVLNILDTLKYNKNNLFKNNMFNAPAYMKACFESNITFDMFLFVWKNDGSDISNSISSKFVDKLTESDCCNGCYFADLCAPNLGGNIVVFVLLIFKGFDNGNGDFMIP